VQTGLFLWNKIQKKPVDFFEQLNYNLNR